MACCGLPSHAAHLLLLPALPFFVVHAIRDDASAWLSATSKLALRSQNLSAKTVTFIRHAESAGNAKLLGALEFSRWDAYKDGMLTKNGANAIQQKLTDMVDMDTDKELIEHVLRSDIVLVSPLRRAMATAIIFLAKAKQLMINADWSDDLRLDIQEADVTSMSSRLKSMKSPDSAADLLPEIRIHADLREKHGSDSDQPGADDKEDPLEYVRRLAQLYGKDMFRDERALTKTYQQIEASYRAEENRTSGWLPVAGDGFTFAEQIRNFKDYLKSISQKKVLIVGHNGWSRFAFASFLPASGNENIERNMCFGTRKVHPLRNLGIIQATFDNGFFTSATPREGDITTGSKWAILVSRTEALAQRVVPANMYFKQFMVFKEKVITPPAVAPGLWKPYVRIILTFAETAQGVVTLGWTDKWGAVGDAAKDFVEIKKNSLVIRQTKLEPLTFDLFVSHAKLFSFMVPSRKEVQQLSQIVASYGHVYKIVPQNGPQK